VRLPRPASPSAPPARAVSRRAGLRLLGGAALAVALPLLGACRPDLPGGAATGPRPEAEPTSAPMPTPAAPAQPSAAHSDAIKVGFVAAFGGVYAALGASMRDGLHLALDRLGHTAGGRHLEVREEDETADPKVGFQRIRKLVDQDRVDVLTGLVSTSTAYAARDFLHDRQCLTVVANAGGRELTRSRKSPYIFRAAASAWQAGFPAGVWAAGHIGTRAVTITPDYEFGHEVGGAFMDGFRSAGGELVGDLHPKLATLDYGPFLPQLVAARPQLVFAFFAGADAVTFTKQFDQFGAKNDVKLFGTGDYVEEGALRTEGVAALGARSAHPWAWGIDTPQNKRLVADFAGRFHRPLDSYAVHQHDALRLIAAAIDARQGDTSDTPALVRALEEVRLDSVRGPLAFDPATHNVVQTVYIREVKEVGGGLHNVVLDTQQGVRDPG
jgi:branched-chain amino acid transport system substrate-binding protein